MVAVSVKTFQDMYEWVMRMVKIPVTDTEALNACKSALNTRYENIAFRKKWRWRKAQWDMKIHQKLTTGTFNITNGSRSVTGTGTGFTTDQEGWFVEFGGRDEIYQIISVDVGTQELQLSADVIAPTNATASHKTFQYQYGLPPDCEELDIVWHDQYRKPMDIISPRKFIEHSVRNIGAEGYGRAVTAYSFKDFYGATLGNFILGHDFLSSENGQDLMMSVFPIVPDEDYIMHILYTKRLTLLDGDADEPLIPIEKRHIMCQGALADMFWRERMDDTAKAWESKYERGVSKMEADREYTDENPRLVASGRKYWGRGRRRRAISPQSADLGSYFDRY